MTIPFHPDPGASIDSLPVNILVVDDVPQNLIAMEALLSAKGINLLLAKSGAEALELLLAHEVALAILDVQMPEMDGFALAELMRGSLRTRDVPIIFLTASPSDPMRSFKGYETGAVDFLHKPIDPYVIIGKVKVFVELYRQRALLSIRNQQLEKALKLNETMMAVLSHDLRTPLSVIVLCADVLKQTLGESNLSKNITHMHASAQRMSRMISQLLDFSRIRSDVLQLSPSRVDLRDIAECILDELRLSHPQRQFSLDVVGNPEGHLDRDRLAQVLSNLVGNAIEHGDPAHEIKVRVDGQDPHYLNLSVSNAGHVRSELLPNLFAPFKAGKASRSGLGLGLYIVDQFVRAHGGNVDVMNMDGHVVFTAHFPRQTSSVVEEDSPVAARTIGAERS